jgi:hypothetical protein
MQTDSGGEMEQEEPNSSTKKHCWVLSQQCFGGAKQQSTTGTTMP